jgi:hypothetical protein
MRKKQSSKKSKATPIKEAESGDKRIGNKWWQLRSKHGRDKIFSSPEILNQECEKYFEATSNRKWDKIEYNGKDAVKCTIPTETPFTLSGLFIFLRIDRKTWDLYRKREDFIPIVTRVEDIIYTHKFEGAAVGAFNANIIARDLGLRDKAEVDHTTGGDKIIQAPPINVYNTAPPLASDESEIEGKVKQ